VSVVASCPGFSQGEREVVRVVGGIAKALGLDDGPTHTEAAIANPSAGSGGALRLTMPAGGCFHYIHFRGFAFALRLFP
jgi:hypothetical protein